MKKVSIYGIGNFGYAVLKHLDKKSNGDFVLHAFDKNPALIDYLNKERKHLFLHKDQEVSEKIIFDRNVKDLLVNCDVLILAITSNATKEVAREIKGYLKNEIVIVNTAKALDWDTGKRISEIIKSELRENKYKYAVLAGGTIAQDLFDHEPLGATVASEDKKTLNEVEKLFESDNLFIYPSNDVTGTEYAASFKNVISILAGITNGLGFSYGAETHIISRAAAEIQDLVTKKLGGKKETFSIGSQCWGNDLWMSCTGNTRNREFGILVGQGIAIEKALQDMQSQNKTVEGINTIKILNNIKGIQSCYIMNLVAKLFGGKINMDQFNVLIFKNNSN